MFRFVVSVLLIGSSGLPLFGQARVPKGGAEFAKALKTRMEVSWSGLTLRDAIQRVSSQHDVAILLDRRVDPNQILSIRIPLAPVESLLERLAQHVRCRVSIVGSVIVIGPPGSTDKLATILELRREQLKLAAEESQRRFLRKGVLRWDDLETPATLLQQLENESGIQIQGREQLPHDLWPANVLPEASWMNRLAIVLAGFDRTFQFTSNNSVRVISFPEKVAITRRYKVRVSDDTLKRLNKGYPDASFERQGEYLQVVGSLETHQTVEGVASGTGTRLRGSTADPEVVLDLKVENVAVGAILKTLEREKKLVLKISPAAQAKLAETVTFNAKRVTLAELLRQTLDPVGLTAKVSGSIVTIDVK